ncbi:MAG: hypothetical protein ACJAXK_003333 [Yoonia sp.]|jgi:hypothetical protein
MQKLQRRIWMGTGWQFWAVRDQCCTKQLRLFCRDLLPLAATERKPAVPDIVWVLVSVTVILSSTLYILDTNLRFKTGAFGG